MSKRDKDSLDSVVLQMNKENSQAHGLEPGPGLGSGLEPGLGSGSEPEPDFNPNPSPIHTPYYTLNFTKAIGSGSFGIVYKGVLIPTDKSKPELSVAIKEIAIKHDNINEIENEIEILQKLSLYSRPDINCYIDHYVDTITNKLYLITLYSDQPSLQETYKNINLSLDVKFKIILNIAKALEFCFDNKIAHRDIKLSNIIADINTGSILLIDFGISCILEKCVHNNSFSIHTVAPEVLLGQQVSNSDDFIKSDIFSFGVIIYQILTGKDIYEDILSECAHDVNKFTCIVRGIVTRPDLTYDFLPGELLSNPDEYPAFVKFNKICNKMILKNKNARPGIKSVIKRLVGLFNVEPGQELGLGSSPMINPVKLFDLKPIDIKIPEEVPQYNGILNAKNIFGTPVKNKLVISTPGSNPSSNPIPTPSSSARKRDRIKRLDEWEQKIPKFNYEYKYLKYKLKYLKLLNSKK